MIDYNVGDRCLRGNSPCEIVSIHRPIRPYFGLSHNQQRNRFNIRYLNENNVNGSNVISWVSYDDIELDKEYYRDLKIKQILDEI